MHRFLLVLVAMLVAACGSREGGNGGPTPPTPPLLTVAMVSYTPPGPCRSAGVPELMERCDRSKAPPGAGYRGYVKVPLTGPPAGPLKVELSLPPEAGGKCIKPEVNDPWLCEPVFICGAEGIAPDSAVSVTCR